jgi:hypothetical protein
MTAKADPLKFLFDLNQRLAKLESDKKPVIGPGLPPAFQGDATLRSSDCLRIE